MRTNLPIRFIFAAVLLTAGFGLVAAPAMAQKSMAYPGTKVMKTSHSYKMLLQKLEAAIKKNKMGLVNRASATVGAKRVLKMTIPGNMVIGVYHPRFAVRMLKASVPAGYEAPIRFYVTENADKTATLTYRTPTSLFAPYGSAELNVMARELDGIFAAIARDATN